MWLQKIDLLGLAIGFALGGAALALFLPRIEAPSQPARLPGPSGAPAALPAPAPLPSIAYPGPPPRTTVAPPLPAVIGPTQPQPDKTAGVAGTGFFIARDGSLLTAAHVVTDCRRTEILSRLVRRTAVDVLATDIKQDIALLRSSHLRPPGILPLGPPVRRASGGPAPPPLLVLGYPASAGLTIPAEAWATLENDRLPPSSRALTDPRDMIWIEAEAVTHGYSGGPVIDPGNGAVVGIIRATIDGAHLRLVHGMPTSGVAIGPGADRLGAFLRQASPDIDLPSSTDTGDAAFDKARRATVHVVCWR
jgi:S1-C subfamily serine protease